MPNYSDINSSFKPHPITNDLQKVTQADAVKSSMINLINIRRYERLMHPEIGASIDQFLFEPINTITATRISSSIEKILKAFEPRAEVLDVDVIPYENLNEYRIEIVFRIRELQEPLTLQTTIKRLR